MMPTLKISAEQEGKRLDVILARTYRDYSRAFLQKWIRDGRVTLAGKPLIPNYRVHGGEMIDVADPSENPNRRGGPRVRPSTSGRHKASPYMPVPSILFEDASILVLNKPAGLVVHPAPSHTGRTLVDWLEDYLGPKITGLFSDSSRLGVVHRLDKNTTGVLLVAKTVVAQNAISKQFQNRTVKKTYVAFIEGIPESLNGVISAPVGRSHTAPSRMAISTAGRPSETSFEVVKSFQKEVSQVSLHPKTGRTHQIRVHCAAIGHPIVGDTIYGASPRWPREFGITRPLLHAERLEIEHPTTHKRVHFNAPWAADMKKALSVFRRAFKVLLVVCLLSGGLLRVAQAENEPAAKPAKAKASAPKTSSSTSGLKREIASLQSQFKSLIEEVSALQDRITGLQSTVDEANASRRLRDMEKALSDLNGKSVSTSSAAEEAKTQGLDLSRKVKAQQEVLDQLHDQVDRLQREIISLKTRAETTPATETPK